MRLFPRSLAVAMLLTLAAAVHADSRYGVAPLPLHQQECASCHVAYPPGLLPAASWQRIMSGLNQHYGTDASLDATSTRAIANWLATHAASGRRLREEPPQDRISRSAWFVHEHDEVSRATWKRASVGSPANCSACHADAATGDFDEHRVRIPK